MRKILIMDLVRVIEGYYITGESELQNFISKMNEKHLHGDGADDGAFLYHIDEKIRWINGREKEEEFIRNVVMEKVNERSITISVQTVKRFEEPTVYHVGSHSLQMNDKATGHEEASTFCREACDINSYLNATCCSQIACSIIDDKDPEVTRATRVLNHFFLEEVVHRAMPVPVANKKHQRASHATMLQEGKLLKEGFESLPNKPESVDLLIKDMASSIKCTDLECATITDSEADQSLSDEDAADVPRLAISRKGLHSWQLHAAYSLYGVVSTNSHPEDRSKDVRSFTKVTEHFNMAFLYNMLYLLPSFVPGLHSSFLYIGTKMSIFCAHCEDAKLWSLNYLFMGAPKIWIIIPPYATMALDHWLSLSGVFLAHTSCRNFLGHKNALPSIFWLREHNIPFKVIIQRPGDLVVLLPNAVHYGFNCGWNLAQAINFATSSWLPEATQQTKCVCFGPTQSHLHLEPLLAAFQPDLLRMYRCRKLIKTSYQAQATIFMHASINGVDPKKASLKRSTDVFQKMPFKVRKQEGESRASSKPGGQVSVSVKSVDQDEVDGSKTASRLRCPVPFCTYSVSCYRQSKAKVQVSNHLQKTHRSSPLLQSYLEDLM